MIISIIDGQTAHSWQNASDIIAFQLQLQTKLCIKRELKLDCRDSSYQKAMKILLD